MLVLYNEPGQFCRYCCGRLLTQVGAVDKGIGGGGARQIKMRYLVLPGDTVYKLVECRVKQAIDSGKGRVNRQLYEVNIAVLF